MALDDRKGVWKSGKGKGRHTPKGRQYEDQALIDVRALLGDAERRLRYSTKRGFYIWDPEAKNKTYINANAAFWNDQDWHGGDVSNEQEYGLRIDCVFTDKFRKQIGIDHLPNY
jgi:hypothetical protein